VAGTGGSLFGRVVPGERGVLTRCQNGGNNKKYGAHEANCTQEPRGEGAEEAAGDEGESQDGAWRRGEEAASVPPRHCGATRDPEVPEEHGAADQEAAISATGARDCAGREGRRLEVPEHRDFGAAGGGGGVFGGAVRGHEPVRASRKAHNYSAKGHTAGATHSRRILK